MPDTQIKNIKQLLSLGGKSLNSAGIETPALDASILLAKILNTSREALIARAFDPVSQNDIASFNALIERRINGECIAYITGKKEFYGLDFEVNQSVLTPRPETEILLEAALNYLKKNNQTHRVLDLCTGSGAIAISLKSVMPYLEVYASDISSNALETAKRNSKRLLNEDNQVKFLQGDLFAALPTACSPLPASNSTLLNSPASHPLFSLITSNPPYIPSDKINSLPREVQNEPRIALDGGGTGLAVISRIIEEAPKFLINGALLLLEADPYQMKEINALFTKSGFHDINIYNDLAGFERVIGGIFG